MFIRFVIAQIRPDHAKNKYAWIDGWKDGDKVYYLINDKVKETDYSVILSTHSQITKSLEKIKVYGKKDRITGRSMAILCHFIGKPELYQPAINEPPDWFESMKKLAYIVHN